MSGTYATTSVYLICARPRGTFSYPGVAKR